MSLINDALKRASQVHKEQVQSNSPAATQAPAAPPMQPAAPPKTSSFPIIVTLVIAAMLVVAGGVIIVRLASAPKAVPQPEGKIASPSMAQNVTTKEPVIAAASVTTRPQNPPKPPTVQSSVALKPAPEAQPVGAPVFVKEQTAATTPAVSQAPAVAPTASAVAAAPETVATNAAAPVVAAVPAPPPVPTFPVIKLQGIFYRKSNPTAMLNGKTLPVGAKVDGAVIKSIEPTTVTLVWKDETKVLELQ